jgi:antitoxin (DNA-binding transcriptional repressor) of toxin-antitoxin stability system
METIHIPESEAACNFPSLMARARAGAEIVIEGDDSPAVILHAAEESPLRRLSESLRLARKNGSKITLDGGFAQDLETVVDSHPEPLDNPWA